MKMLGFIALAIILNIFGNGNSMATPKNDTKLAWGRVFGGYLVPRDSDYKQGFTVFIGYFADTNNPYPDYTCSGVIITEDYIVSTAQCLTNEGLSTDGFYVSITGLKGTRFEREITETHIHEEYNPETLNNNLALGKVDESYDLESGELFVPLSPGSDWGVDYFTGKALTVCGHRNPYTTDSYYDFEPTCNVFIPRNRLTCSETYTENFAENEVCASSSKPDKISVCERDFGAGLIYVDDEFTFYLYAIASYTLENSCAVYPTVYLVLNDFVPWIESHMA